jgi:cytidyltransferase-like protein
MQKWPVESMPKQPERLKNYFYTRDRPANELEWYRYDELPAELSRPIVLVTGGFDLLHCGHMRLLFAAREKAGDKGTLVAAMNSDRMIKETKGCQRPIMSWPERAATLGYMPIDYLVEIDSADELRKLTLKLRPDLKVMGADHLASASKWPWMRKMFVRSTGMRTSEIVRRVREGYGTPTD